MAEINEHTLKRYIRNNRNRKIKKIISFNILGDLVYVVYDDKKDIRELNILASDLYDFDDDSGNE